MRGMTVSTFNCFGCTLLLFFRIPAFRWRHKQRFTWVKETGRKCQRPSAQLGRDQSNVWQPTTRKVRQYGWHWNFENTFGRCDSTCEGSRPWGWDCHQEHVCTRHSTVTGGKFWWKIKIRSGSIFSTLKSFLIDIDKLSSLCLKSV